MLDRAAHWFQVEDVLREKLDIAKGKKVSYIDLKEYHKKTFIKRGSSKNKVAVIFAEGEIVYGADEKGMVSEKTYHKIFDKIRSDDRFKAVVLRDEKSVEVNLFVNENGKLGVQMYPTSLRDLEKLNLQF